MARIILTLAGATLQEMTLAKERVTIGRGRQNDIIIDDLAISAEHAVIVTKDKDSFLEDLNSTNGTQVNGQPIKKHFLQQDDVIELAHYNIRYSTDACKHGGFGEMPAVLGVATRQAVASIRQLTGPNAGKEISLSKTLTTIGKPGIQTAVITHHSHGYYISRVEGRDHYLLVNGMSIGNSVHAISNGDIIDLAGIRMVFSLV